MGKEKKILAVITEKEMELLARIGDPTEITALLMESFWAVAAKKRRERRDWWEKIREKYAIKQLHLELNCITMEITDKKGG